MGAIFDIVAIPLGWLLGLIYKVVPNYFGAIFLFTLVTRLLLFPLSLKSQKSQAERIKLQPRLQRLQKKYQNDPKKLQEKQMALYEKEGVSPAGGCAPMLVQMLILFGIISVIYAPVKNLTSVPDAVINTAITVVNKELPEAQQKRSYYKELYMLNNLDKHEEEVKKAIVEMKGDGEQALYTTLDADKYYDEMVSIKEQFTLFGVSLLENPWNEKGFAGINWLWLVALISGLTSLLSSLVSMHFSKKSTAGDMNDKAQGCSNFMMLLWMPLFSLYISFTVPGGVGVYWICSNIIALGQTTILNKIYDPVKIREQAEIEYEERRKQRQEDKKRLAESRAREQRALAEEQNAQKKGEKKPQKKVTENTAPETSEPSVETDEKG